MSQHRVKLSAPQTRAYRASTPGSTVTLAWSRGVGKSWYTRVFWYLLIARWEHRHRPGSPTPGVRIVMLMPTLEQAKKVHSRLMLDELGEGGAFGFLKAKINRSDWSVTFPGGSVISWVTAERAKNIRGIRCDVICADEADDIDIEVYEAIAAPWLSEPHSLAITLLTGTPTRGRHGLLYRKYKMGLPGPGHVDGHHSFHATYLDVPEYVDVARIERDRPHIDPALFAREWLCDFDSAEGLVYPMFKESFHVRPADPRASWTEILVGVDHGYEDPGVYLVIGVSGHGRDAVCHVLTEVYQQHETEQWWVEQAQAIKARYPHATWYADPSQPARIKSLKQLALVKIQGADKHGSKQSIKDGVACVADRLIIRSRADGSQYAKLYVDPSCVNTIREFGLYRRRRDPLNKERILDEIMDRDNHSGDSCRYALFSKFGHGTRSVTDEGAGWQ